MMQQCARVSIRLFKLIISYANPLYLPGVTVGPLVGLLDGLRVGLSVVGGLVSPGLVGRAVGFLDGESGVKSVLYYHV
jgi:hypothetical protein